jgi:ATP-dependent RNA helicase DDX19/DBP5
VVVANCLSSALRQTTQIVLFSATFPEHVSEYSKKFAKDPNEIRLQHEELTVEGIKQLYIDCNDEEEKYNNLVQLYGLLTVGSSIIFVRVRIQKLHNFNHFG